MRTLKQEGIPFRIEGDYFLTGRQSLSHRFSEWVKLFLFNSLSLSLQQPLLNTTREFLGIIVRNAITSVANFV